MITTNSNVETMPTPAVRVPRRRISVPVVKEERGIEESDSAERFQCSHPCNKIQPTWPLLTVSTVILKHQKIGVFGAKYLMYL